MQDPLKSQGTFTLRQCTSMHHCVDTPSGESSDSIKDGSVIPEFWVKFAFLNIFNLLPGIEWKEEAAT